MSLVNINGDDHVSLAAPFLGQVNVFDSVDRGQLMNFNRIFFPSVSSFQVEGFGSSFISYDGYRPSRWAGILKLSAPLGAPPPRPESGYLYPRRTQ